MSAPVLVYGLGRSGLAALRRLVADGRQVAFADRKSAGPDVDEAMASGAQRVDDVTAWLHHRTGGEPGDDRPLADRSSADRPLVVAAPGVPIDHPDLDTLRAAGANVIGEVEYVWRTVPGTYVAVTGTAGKGSVTRWTADTLSAAGLDAVAGGNIDPALAAVARAGAVHVVEMSSFQLERCERFRPDVAVMLNLGEDHIDRHGSVEKYHAAKRRLLTHLGSGQTLVTNADDPILERWAEDAARAGARVRRFSLTGPADARFDAERGLLELDGVPLLQRDDLHVLGEHQVANALAVSLTADALGVDPGAIAAGLRGFTGLPGRYAAAGTVGAIRFIEDSIATRPLAVAAALRATPRPLVWIAGGQGKGADMAGLAPLVAERVDLLVAIGASRDALAHAFEAVVPVVRVTEADGRAALRAAVREAVRYLEANHAGRGHVLLAPLAASFDQFHDYVDRAAAFREAVADAGRAARTASRVEAEA